MELGLDGRVALITGAASGIGRRTAERFIGEGAHVVATDVRPLPAELDDRLRASGGLAFRQDVAAEADWSRVMDQTLAALGRLDVLVNNAGVVRIHNLETLSLEDWRADNRVNIDGVFLGTRAAILAMRIRGGSIVNVSSVAAMAGIHTAAGYCAGKGAVRSFTKAAALHCASHGYDIRINSIHPGYVDTPMVADLIATAPDPVKARRALENQQATRRLGTTDDIAAGVLYLASDAARFMTGSELVIDGGYLAR